MSRSFESLLESSPSPPAPVSVSRARERRRRSRSRERQRKIPAASAVSSPINMGRSYSYRPSPSPKSYERRMRRSYRYSPSPPSRRYSSNPSRPPRSSGRRMRRSYSYNPSSPPSYGRKASRPIPRGRYDGRPTNLLVKNLHRGCRPEDLRRPFEEFGRVKDIYIPKYSCSGVPRRFGFVEYYDPDDAAAAKYNMDKQVILGSEITVIFADNRRIKKPSVMRARDQIRSPRHSPPPRRSPSYSRYRTPQYARGSRAE
ncbi:hypothetical protein GUJ93_ZPchr0013g35426 [Zizania palustris]|uniref:RRM domain-containing protein n=1 Tax=Zizania palustris TaxID=103762 RepID=A0A8J5WWZ2_ZIZPA|nr:hypothetical protein GUJ93_ZPchr0013g35426 [Zizania palustris]